MDTQESKIYSLKEAMSAAYKSENPVMSLGILWERRRFTKQDLQRLVKFVFHRNKCDESQKECLEDMMRLVRTEETPETTKFRFIYFATCIPHLWGEWEPNGKMCLKHIKQPIVAFVGPNEAVPYVWFHILDDEKLLLVKHVLPIKNDGTPLWVKLYRIRNNVMEKDQRIAYDLQTNRPMKTVGKGSYLQICHNVDKVTITMPNGGATNLFNMVVVLTLGKDYQLCNVYHNDTITAAKPRLKSLAVVCHEANDRNRYQIV